jgi:hypothetical protein
VSFCGRLIRTVTRAVRILARSLAPVMFLVVPLAAALSGCSTNAAIRDVMLPYNTVRQTVVSNLPFGLRKQSINGRELTSNYFSGTNIANDGAEAADRAYAYVVILGSSRPFQITVKVVRERRGKKSRSYAVVGEDKKLTHEMVKRLKEALADRREDRNVIDDFRAF